MLYELLTGQVPISAKRRESYPQPLVEPKTSNSAISDRTNKAILWALELEADKRPQSIQEWFKNLGLSIPKTKKSEMFRPIVINWTVVWAGVAAIAALLTAFGLPELIKQKLTPQPTPTVSPQKSPSAKP